MILGLYWGLNTNVWLGIFSVALGIVQAAWGFHQLKNIKGAGAAHAA